MPNFIDRRLNPKDKSLGNRQRFMKRAREELKRVVNEQVRSGKIADVDSGHFVPVPAKGTGEPTFQHAGRRRRREHVLPGNKEFRTGDRIDASPAGRRQRRQGRGRTRRDVEDDFRFVLSRDEFLELFFEDLELPDLVKRTSRRSTSYKPRRAGFAITGSPTNLNVGRTMRNELWPPPRAAGARSGPSWSRSAERDRASWRRRRSPSAATLRAARRSARGARRTLTRRRKLIPYVDPVDVRFNRFEPQPRAERQCGDVLPDGRVRLDGRAREGSGQALLRAAAPVPQAALRPHRHRLHPPHPRGAGGRRGHLLPLARRAAAPWCRRRSRRCSG